MTQNRHKTQGLTIFYTTRESDVKLVGFGLMGPTRLIKWIRFWLTYIILLLMP
jgi:hypothetical protein